jgi:hypothetical protein
MLQALENEDARPAHVHSGCSVRPHWYRVQRCTAGSLLRRLVCSYHSVRRCGYEVDVPFLGSERRAVK